MRLSLPRGASHRRRQGQPLACSRIPRRLPRPGLVKGRAEQEDGHSVRIGSVRVNTQKLTLMTGVSMRCDSHCKPEHNTSAPPKDMVEPRYGGDLERNLGVGEYNDGGEHDETQLPETEVATEHPAAHDTKARDDDDEAREDCGLDLPLPELPRSEELVADPAFVERGVFQQRLEGGAVEWERASVSHKVFFFRSLSLYNTHTFSGTSRSNVARMTMGAAVRIMLKIDVPTSGKTF